MTEFHIGKIESRLGDLLLVTDSSEDVHALAFAEHRSKMLRNLSQQFGDLDLADDEAPARVVVQLQRYFNGDLEALKLVSVVMTGTEVQQKVWSALRDIPAGSTTSYGVLARQLGYDDPRMAFEIGVANGANPVAIIVPCHRVIGSDGKLTGYAGGLQRKQALLDMESAARDGRDVPTALSTRQLALL